MAFTLQELAEMYAQAARNKEQVVAVERRGSAPSVLMNEIFDADIVLGMWRSKRGGIGYMPVKGMDHLLRIVEQDEPERLRMAYYDFGSYAACQAIADRYDERPSTRWQEAYVDGRRVGFELM